MFPILSQNKNSPNIVKLVLGTGGNIIGGTVGGMVGGAVNDAFAGVAVQPQAIGNAFCDNCGAKLTPGAAFCDECGAPQSSPDTCSNSG